MGKALYQRWTLGKPMKMMTKTAVGALGAGAVAEEGAEAGAAVVVQEVQRVEQEERVPEARARHELGAAAAVEGPLQPTGHRLHHLLLHRHHRQRADKPRRHLLTMRMSTVGLQTLLNASPY